MDAQTAPSPDDPPGAYEQDTRDPDGEALRAPRGLAYVWVALVILIAAEAVRELFKVGGPAALYEDWVHDTVLVIASGLCLARAVREPRGRMAWLAFGAGMACWSVGTVLWSLLYSSNPSPPYPTFCDGLWIAWYPLTGIGVALLIRMRVSSFELHRWIDGIAMALMALAGGYVLVANRVGPDNGHHVLATIVDLAYPVLDTILVGSILGVFGLTAWRPGRVWISLGFGCVIMAVADAAFAVEQARGIPGGGDSYSFIWTAGAVLIAYAAWAPAPRSHGHTEMLGWQAIALPLTVQLLAAGVQAYGLIDALAISDAERVVTLAVLLIASLQIVVSRPRGGDRAP